MSLGKSRRASSMQHEADIYLDIAYCLCHSMLRHSGTAWPGTCALLQTPLRQLLQEWYCDYGGGGGGAGAGAGAGRGGGAGGGGVYFNWHRHGSRPLPAALTTMPFASSSSPC